MDGIPISPPKRKVSGIMPQPQQLSVGLNKKLSISHSQLPGVGGLSVGGGGVNLLFPQVPVHSGRMGGELLRGGLGGQFVSLVASSAAGSATVDEVKAWWGSGVGSGCNNNADDW